jgi:hypothetical protein
MKIPFWNVVVALAFLTGSSSAYSHGIAGNRYFDGTLTFDDPAAADEAILPNYSNLDHPAQGSTVAENPHRRGPQGATRTRLSALGQKQT